MIWWLRQRGAFDLLPFSLFAFVLSISLTSNLILVLPAYLGNYSVPTELSNFFCLVPSVALVSCLERRLPGMERSAVRRLDARDIALVTGFALLASAVATAMTPLDSEAMWTAARNNLLFCGLALGSWPLLGHRASLLPAFWMILAMFTGGRHVNDPYPWVIVTEKADVAHAATGAALVFLTGLVLLTCLVPRTAR
ncbi:hypothetical protein OG349_16475 [Streptomyces sp. NBC_01317]|uniref:hypothetical protein n=1 Tax=Streptomyces sp. NBC_01317 TaxID=2903822 RepID=UPI002E14DF2A|nr:hypothetical protein OG349_16475 [Streptomyces sp. NBC_01317]